MPPYIGEVELAPDPSRSPNGVGCKERQSRPSPCGGRYDRNDRPGYGKFRSGIDGLCVRRIGNPSNVWKLARMGRVYRGDGCQHGN